MSNSSVNFDIEITINATPERVFAAMTTGTGVWWGPPYTENQEARDLVFEAKIGGRFYEKWDYTSDDKAGALLATVIAIKKPELLTMRGQFGMSRKILFGVVTIELERLSAGTLLKFSHNAFGNFSTEELELDYKHNWDDLLNKLKNFVEEGSAEGVRHDPSLDIDREPHR